MRRKIAGWERSPGPPEDVRSEPGPLSCKMAPSPPALASHRFVHTSHRAGGVAHSTPFPPALRIPETGWGEEEMVKVVEGVRIAQLAKHEGGWRPKILHRQEASGPGGGGCVRLPPLPKWT